MREVRSVFREVVAFGHERGRKALAPSRSSAVGGLRPGRVALLAVALLLGGFFVFKTAVYVKRYSDIISTAYSAPGAPKLPRAGDFTMFYTGARLILSDERTQTYDKTTLVREVLRTQGLTPDNAGPPNPWIRYYNPPFYLVLFHPLTFLDVHSGYLVSIGLNIVAFLGLCALIGSILRWRQPMTALLILALTGSTPLYFTFQHAQPSLLLAILVAGGFLAFEQGKSKMGAVLLAISGLKPQWLALPAIVVIRRNPKALAPIAVAIGSIIVLPFALVGFGGTVDYVRLVLERGSGDVSDPLYAGALLSWSGFLRALTGSTQPVLWFVLSGVTLVVFVQVLLSGDSRLSAAAAMLTTLLVVPHSHPQDWVVVVPAVALLLSRPSSQLAFAGVVLGAVAIYFGVNDWVPAQASVSLGRREVFWVTPAACALLFWLAAIPRAEARAADAPEGASLNPDSPYQIPK